MLNSMRTLIAERTERALRSLAGGGAGTADLLRAAMRQVSSEVAADAWCGLTLDPATMVMTGGVHEHGLAPAAIRRLLEIEYGEDDLNRFADLARALSGGRALAVGGRRP